MQTRVLRLVILFTFLSVCGINAFSQSFVKNGIYYVGDKDTKEATVIQANNKVEKSDHAGSSSILVKK